MDTLFRHMASCCSGGQGFASQDADGLASGLAKLQLTAAGSSTPTHSTRSRAATAASASPAGSPANPATAADELRTYRLFTFDIETTGLSPAYDAIIEMAVVDMASSSSWSSLVRPVPFKKSSKAAFAAHGISDAALRQYGTPTLPVTWQRMLQFIADNVPQGAVPVLVAHNGYTFDFKMLSSCLHRQQQQQQQQQQQEQGSQAGSQHPDGIRRYFSSSSSSNNGSAGPGSNNRGSSSSQLVLHELLVLDTLHLLRSLKLKNAEGVANMQQATLVQHFLGSVPEVTHRALADAQQLALLLPHLLSWAAEQADSCLDERLLPRTLASFAAAAATAASAAAATAAAGGAGAAAGEADAGREGLQGDRVEPSAAAAAASGRGGGRGRRGASSRGSGSSRARATGSSRSQQTAPSSSARPGATNAGGLAVIAAAAVELDAASTEWSAPTDSELSAAAAELKNAGNHVSQPGLAAACHRAARKGEAAEPAEAASSSAAATWNSSSSSSGSVEEEDQQQHACLAGSNTCTGGSSTASGRGGGLGSQAPAEAAAALGSTADPAAAALGGGTSGRHCVMLRGSPVPVLTAAAFMQTVEASIQAASSVGGSSGSGCSAAVQQCGGSRAAGVLHLGQYVQGRSDAASGFCDVLLGPQGLPVVFVLEGLLVSKELKLSLSPDGKTILAASLLVKAVNRRQQQQLKQVAAAVDRITALLLNQQRQQQFQQQQVFSCMSGASMQVRLACRRGAPFLETNVKQYKSSSSSSSSSSAKALVTVPTPCLSAPGAAAVLQQMLPVGGGVNVALWPSCVWSNSRFRGVTLNCVEVWRQ